MADLSYYAYTRPTALAVALNNTDTTVQLVDGSSFPDPAVPGNGQYTAILAYGTDREEIVTVTGKPSGNTLTVIRGQDGSAALAQNAGDVVVHGVSARDFRGSLQTTGGTMTGPLILDADATAPLEAVPFQQLGTVPLGSVPLQQVQDIVDAAVRAAMPIGSVIDYGGQTAPSGWLVCDGASIPAQYTELISRVGATTPDLKGRFTMAPSTSHPLGETPGGSDTVKLTANESGLRAHSHGVTVQSGNATHSHNVSGSAAAVGNHTHPAPAGYNFLLTNPGGWANGSNATGGVQRPSGYSTGTDAGGAHGHSVSGSADSQAAAHAHGASSSNNTALDAVDAHNNLPPYYVMLKIIKAL